MPFQILLPPLVDKLQHNFSCRVYVHMLQSWGIVSYDLVGRFILHFHSLLSKLFLTLILCMYVCLCGYMYMSAITYRRQRGHPVTWSWSSRPPECVLELNFHSLQGQCALKY